MILNFKLDLRNNLKSLPDNFGIYIFLDKFKNIIYIGKAKNLKKRISNYFLSNHKNSPKTSFLVKNIFSVDFIITDSEIEALILENKLIKKNKPKYNINLKDDKTYPYIKITNQKIPKIIKTRIVKDDGAFYFGPFTSRVLREEIIRIVIELFKIITNKTYLTNSKLNYQIGLAPSILKSEIDVKKYNIQVRKAIDFLNGNYAKVILDLKKKMILASKNLEFEKALKLKLQINSIKELKDKQKVDKILNYNQDLLIFIKSKDNLKSQISVFNILKGTILSKKNFNFDYFKDDLFIEFIKIFYSKNVVPSQIIVNLDLFKDDFEKEILENYLKKFRGSKPKIIFPKIGEKKKLINMGEKTAVFDFKNDINVLIQKALNLKKIPKVIDFFDMSNLGFDFLVGASTRWNNLQAEKKEFRKFEIKSFSKKNDDFLATKECVYRRYKTCKNLPDLIIVDGGKGQLKFANFALKELNLKIPIISLAKKNEEIFILGKENSLKFNKNSSMMLFIRNMRDKTHGFVINYNREKRKIKLKKDTKKIF